MRSAVLRPATPSQIYIVLLDDRLPSRPQPFEEVSDDRRLVLRVAPRPRAGLDLEVKALSRRLEQPIDVDVELHAPIPHEPASTVFFNLPLALRFEVLAVEPR